MWPSFRAIGSVSTCPCNYCPHPPLCTSTLVLKSRLMWMNIRINDDDDEKKLTGSSRDPQRPSKMFRYLVVEGPPVTWPIEFYRIRIQDPQDPEAIFINKIQDPQDPAKTVWTRSRIHEILWENASTGSRIRQDPGSYLGTCLLTCSCRLFRMGKSVVNEEPQTRRSYPDDCGERLSGDQVVTTIITSAPVKPITRQRTAVKLSPARFITLFITFDLAEIAWCLKHNHIQK